MEYPKTMSHMIFSSLNEILEEKRAIWGRRVTLLVLRPPGDCLVTHAEVIGEMTITFTAA